MQPRMVPPVPIENVKVVAEGYPLGKNMLVCDVRGKRITFHPSHRLPDTTIHAVGDVGTLVVSQAVALTLGLA